MSSFLKMIAAFLLAMLALWLPTVVNEMFPGVIAPIEVTFVPVSAAFSVALASLVAIMVAVALFVTELY